VKSSSLLLRSLATALLFVSFASCSENLDSSGVCSVLCPLVGGDVQNVTLDAVVLDTTVQSLSGLGTEPGLLLASRGDTLDTRVIIRFDSLPATFAPKGDTVRPITTVDGAYLQLRIDTLSIKGPGPVTIEAYDVDTTANDTSSAPVLALFRPDRFISSQSFNRADLKDTVKYYISNAAVLAKIQNKAQLRIGLRATGSSSSQMRIVSTEGGAPPLLFIPRNSGYRDGAADRGAIFTDADRRINYRFPPVRLHCDSEEPAGGVSFQPRRRWTSAAAGLCAVQHSLEHHRLRHGGASDIASESDPQFIARPH